VTDHPPERVNDVPRMSREQIRETVVGLLENRIFVASSLPEGENLSAHFLPLMDGFGGMDTTQIGNIIGDMRDAADMGINGYPCFFKCRIVHKDDWKAIRDLALKADAAIHGVIDEAGDE
jgi:hypothetical protein